MIEQAPMLHPSAEVAPSARVGNGTSIWHQARVREGAVIGENCVLGTGAYVDCDVVIGNKVKIQNHALLYRGVRLEDGVFIGPRACLTNDRYPRAINPGGALKQEEDWTVGPILVSYGASVGAGAVILPGVTIGRFAMVAAGAVVTRNVPDYGLVMGVPAHLDGFVCRCGQRLNTENSRWHCWSCGGAFEIIGGGSSIVPITPFEVWRGMELPGR